MSARNFFLGFEKWVNTLPRNFPSTPPSGPCGLGFAEGDTLFRPEGDCAIIHVVVFSFRSFMASCILQENEARRSRFFSGGEERSSSAKRFQTGEAVARAMPIGVKIGGSDGV